MSMINPASAEEVIDLLITEVRKIAKERPDAHYQRGERGCRYLTGQAGRGCGCLLGQAIQALPDTVLGLELKARIAAADAVGSVGIDEVLTGFFVKPAKVYWLARVQTAQDNGVLWPACISKADSLAALDERYP